uniref:ETS domain-containing protein n=1 Tax=Acrobeloides nanus TaxID=290746 RepID=A0A914EG55_9BILA
MAFLSTEEIDTLCEFLYCDVSEKLPSSNNLIHKLLQEESQDEACFSELENPVQISKKQVSPENLRKLTQLVRSYVNAPLLNFIADLLDNPYQFDSVVGWSNSPWSFEIRDAKIFSTLWSSKTSSKDVSYIKISRALKSFENFNLAGWPILKKVGTCRGKARASTVYLFQFFFGYEGYELPPLTTQDKPLFPVVPISIAPYTKRSCF